MSQNKKANVLLTRAEIKMIRANMVVPNAQDYDDDEKLAKDITLFEEIERKLRAALQFLGAKQP